MKLDTMEKALKLYPNRFQLTMMAVARAREINEGDRPLVEFDDIAKPVVTALAEISEDAVAPATHDEMGRIREAKRMLREKALMEAGEQDDEPDGDAPEAGHSEQGEDTEEN